MRAGGTARDGVQASSCAALAAGLQRVQGQRGLQSGPRRTCRLDGRWWCRQRPAVRAANCRARSCTDGGAWRPRHTTACVAWSPRGGGFGVTIIPAWLRRRGASLFREPRNSHSLVFPQRQLPFRSLNESTLLASNLPLISLHFSRTVLSHHGRRRPGMSFFPSCSKGGAPPTATSSLTCNNFACR